jgi:uncharacterized protein
MPDSATLAVLRDVASLTVIAMMLGIVAYGGLRLIRPGIVWGQSGNVDARAFSLPDIYVAVMLGMIMLWGLDGQGDASKSASDLSLSLILLNMVFMLALCVLLLLYVVILRGMSPAELFGLRRLSFAKAAGIALIAIIPLYMVVSLVAAAVTWWAKDVWPDIQPQDAVKAFKTASSPSLKATMGIAAVIVAPLVEETVFRGFIYGVLKRYTDGWFAAVCSALLFAIVHMHVGSLVPLFVLALGLCAAYERTGSLLVPMTMHALFNGVSTTLLLLYPHGPK